MSRHQRFDLIKIKWWSEQCILEQLYDLHVPEEDKAELASIIFKKQMGDWFGPSGSHYGLRHLSADPSLSLIYVKSMPHHMLIGVH